MKTPEERLAAREQREQMKLAQTAEAMAPHIIGDAVVQIRAAGRALSWETLAEAIHAEEKEGRLVASWYEAALRIAEGS